MAGYPQGDLRPALSAGYGQGLGEVFHRVYLTFEQLFCDELGANLLVIGMSQEGRP